MEWHEFRYSISSGSELDEIHSSICVEGSMLSMHPSSVPGGVLNQTPSQHTHEVGKALHFIRKEAVFQEVEELCHCHPAIKRQGCFHEKSG